MDRSEVISCKMSFHFVFIYFLKDMFNPNESFFSSQLELDSQKISKMQCF